jgi:hypothetical protein
MIIFGPIWLIFAIWMCTRHPWVVIAGFLLLLAASNSGVPS